MLKKNVNIAFIGGGSMDFGKKFISEICYDSSLTGTVRLYDIDKKFALANEVAANKTIREFSKEEKSDIIFIATDTLEETLRDADFVVISIDVGDVDVKINDIKTPELYGIYQTCSSAIGVGGFFNALRILPYYIEIANKTKSLCPNAWVINLSEPMSACLKMLYTVFPKIKAFGCSNDVFSLQDLLIDLIKDNDNIDDISKKDVKVNFVGINKFCFANELMYKGDNLLNLYDSNASKYAKSGYEKVKIDFKSNPYLNSHKIKFDFYLRYREVVATNDMFFAGNFPIWYCGSLKNINNWKLGVISPSYLRKKEHDKIIMSKKMLNGEEYLEYDYSGTDCLAQIKALLGQKDIMTNVVYLNSGQVNNLDKGSIVETNALFSENYLKPVFAGCVSNNTLLLTEKIINNTNKLVDSVLNKDLECAFNVFLDEPSIILNLNKSNNLYKEMIEHNKKYLEYYLN